MSGAEKFCLRWNDFESNVSTAFRELREEKDFFDVTLACEDEQIHAHKVILGACSSFFRLVGQPAACRLNSVRISFKNFVVHFSKVNDTGNKLNLLFLSKNSSSK